MTYLLIRRIRQVYGSDPAAADGPIRTDPPTSLRCGASLCQYTPCPLRERERERERERQVSTPLAH